MWRARSPQGSLVALKSAPRQVGFGIQHEALVIESIRRRRRDGGYNGLLLPVSIFTEADRLVLVLPWAEHGDAAAFARDAGALLQGDEALLWTIARNLSMGLNSMHSVGT